MDAKVHYVDEASAGEFAKSKRVVRAVDRAPCRLWGCCGLEMPSHFSTCPPDLQDGSTPTNPCAHELSEEIGSRTSSHPPPLKTPVLAGKWRKGKNP